MRQQRRRGRNAAIGWPSITPTQSERSPFAAPPAVALVVMLAASGTTPRIEDGRLYRDLGERPGIDRLVTALLDIVRADERIAFLFENTDFEYLHQQVRDQLCAEAGGPFAYRGLAMDEAHAGLGIREHEFNAFVDDQVTAMERLGYATPTQNRLLGLPAPMRRDILHR